MVRNIKIHEISRVTRKGHKKIKENRKCKEFSLPARVDFHRGQVTRLGLHSSSQSPGSMCVGVVAYTLAAFLIVCYLPRSLFVCTAKPC